MVEAVRVFFSYSHEDEKLRDKLAQHLSILKREGIIAEWHDRQIGAGTEWANEIDTQLNDADIILLLISASFLSSDYCWSVELKRAMERHEAGEACVIPVILRPVEWKGAPFGKLQAFPKDALPVTKWQDQDEALMNVAAGIRQAVERLQTVKQQTHSKLIPSPDDRASQQARETGQEETLYREDVQNCLVEDGGELSPISRVFLDGLRDSLNLSSNRAVAIELDLLKPYQNYAQTFQGMVQQEYPLSPTHENRLKRLQQNLALIDEAVRAIESRILAARKPEKQQSKPVASFPDEAALSSERFGASYYAKLRDLLKAGKWREADQETGYLMLEVMDRQEEGWLRMQEIQNFPCQDLLNIDRLWVYYSKGKFGFSVQKRIWEECGSPSEYNKDWIEFCDRVGWGKVSNFWDYDKLTFNPEISLAGELPFPAEFGGLGEDIRRLWLLICLVVHRLADCNIQ